MVCLVVFLGLFFMFSGVNIYYGGEARGCFFNKYLNGSFKSKFYIFIDIYNSFIFGIN